MNRREVIAAGAAALPVLGLAAAASAQTPRTKPAAGGATADSQDTPLAACVLIKGHKQIEVCRAALAKIEDTEVKAFAQAEIDEHETLKKKLQKLGYDAPTPLAGFGAAGTTGAGTGTAGRAQTADGTPTRSTAGTATAAGGVTVGRHTLPADLAMQIEIAREVGEQCIQTNKTETAPLKGLDFDKRFVGSQLDAHYDLLDHGVVFRKHCSAEMAPVLDEAKKIIDQHIAVCKQLMSKLETKKA